MTKPFNPSRFADMLDESHYATGPKREELKRERAALVKWLRKKGKGSQDCLNLADKIEPCRPRHRCQSAACPACAAAEQRLIADAARRLLKAEANGNTRIVCVSVVPADGMVKPGKLNKADHNRAIRRWKERLGRAGVDWFIGATVLSLNEHKQGRHKPRWSKHIYGVTVTGDAEKLKQGLKGVFPKAKAISRPVKIEEWDGDKKALPIS